VEVDRLLAGERRAVARALSVVERGGADAEALIARIFERTGRAHVVGVTGSGGAGKSALLAALAAAWRKRGRTVGIVAVDPTSAASGGALLGDRVRMESLLGDAGVFVRSMATRGATGGLARTTIDAARVLDAAGFDVVAVETIGAGQDQLDVVGTVETVVVVEAPNMGDDVQALKAGLGEAGDLYVVAKADLPGADRSAAALRQAIALDPPRDGWRPRVLQASAATGGGIDALAEAIDEHRAWLAANPEVRRARAEAAAAAELRRVVIDALLRRAALDDGALAEAVRAIATRHMTAQQAVERLLGQP
jgi:LAO/AO transport system kinase